MKSIVRLALFVLVLFALAASTHAQSCQSSTIYQSPNPGVLSGINPPVPCSTTSILNPATVLFSQTNSTTDYCSNLSYASIVTGYGVAHCTPTVLYCYPEFSLEVTLATSTTDYNRFYNRAYDFTYSSSSGCVRVDPINVSRQDFWQCAWVTCPSTSGGGGCPPCYVYNYKGGLVRPASVCCDPSPILLDISGRGFVLTSADNGVKFDISGTGHVIQMAWTAQGADNAFLALPGADGLVHNGTQLFGNFTPQPPSATPNGFAALAVYDDPKNGGNGDGVIDSKDAIFSSLRLWIDANHDGISQPEELHTLPSLGVNSISLNYKAEQRADQWGNVFHYRAQVNPGDPASVGRLAYDVFFVGLAPININTAENKCQAPTNKVGMLAPVSSSLR